MQKCIKTRFCPTPDVQNSFLKKSFWWSGSIHKCIKTGFKPLQTIKNIFFSEHFSGGLELCENATKYLYVFSHYGRSKISFLKKSF
jgi:hypothetical protein